MKPLNCFLLITLVFSFFSCDKSEKEVGKLSPPKWIQGEWEYDDIMYKEYFKFTRDDVVFELYGAISSFSNLYEDGNYTIEETKTDEVYEITITREQSKQISKFIKGDDRTYINYYTFDPDFENICLVISTLYKK